MSKATEESTELVSTGAEVDSGELVPIPKGDLLKVLSGQIDISLVKVDGAEMARRLAAEAMKAESEEDLNRSVPTWSTKAHVGEVFKIIGLRGVYPSKFRNADTDEKGQFVSWGAVNLLDGEIGVLNTSSGRINATLGWYYDHGLLPQDFEIVVVAQSTDSFDVLGVEKR